MTFDEPELKYRLDTYAEYQKALNDPAAMAMLLHRDYPGDTYTWLRFYICGKIEWFETA